MLVNPKTAVIGKIVKGTYSGVDEIDYLGIEEGIPNEFTSKSAAIDWLIQAGYNPNDYVIRVSIGRCFRCNNSLYISDNEEYASQCFHCCEDFYSFEQETEQMP